jgi:DNA polymerase-3 subunit delta'
MAAGRLDRASRLLDPAAAEQRETLIQIARSVYVAERFDSGAAARVIVELGRAAGARAREEIGEAREGETARELDQRARRAARGAEREEIVESLELLAGWYRDLLAVGVGAEIAALNADRLVELQEDAGRVGIDAAGRAVEAVSETRRRFDLNVHAQLALEALFLVLRRELGRAAASVA